MQQVCWTRPSRVQALAGADAGHVVAGADAGHAVAGADAGHAVAGALYADDVLYRRRRSLSAAMPTLGPNWRRCWCAATAASCRSSAPGVSCSTAVGRPGVTGIRILMAGRWGEAGSHRFLDPDAALHRVSISDLLAPYFSD